MSNVSNVTISVPEELKEHFTIVKQLRDEILESRDSTDRDRISAVKAMSGEIKVLSDIQNDVYNAEKFAILQQAIVNILKDYDRDFHDKVIELLEEGLAKLS